jgi:hypothetical protein
MDGIVMRVGARPVGNGVGIGVAVGGVAGGVGDESVASPSPSSSPSNSGRIAPEDAAVGEGSGEGVDVGANVGAGVGGEDVETVTGRNLLAISGSKYGPLNTPPTTINKTPTSIMMLANWLCFSLAFD